VIRLLFALIKVVLWPVRLVIRLVVAILGRIFSPFVGRLDSSDNLSNFINQISSSMATQRGLLLMTGTVLLVLSLVVHGLVVVILVASSSFDRVLYWLCIPFMLFHVGVLVGFTGIMLATPLGQGYKDNK
jgi:hypothetical protein